MSIAIYGGPGWETKLKKGKEEKNDPCVKKKGYRKQDGAPKSLRRRKHRRPRLLCVSDGENPRGS